MHHIAHLSSNSHKKIPLIESKYFFEEKKIKNVIYLLLWKNLTQHCCSAVHPGIMTLTNVSLREDDS